jgi:hypothetical protein
MNADHHLSAARSCLHAADTARNADTWHGDRDAASVALALMACGHALTAIADRLVNGVVWTRSGNLV